MAEGICADVVTNVANTLVEKAMKEAKYLCCYQSYIDDFQMERNRLSARVKNVRLDIEEAKKRNENQIDPEVQQWLDEADSLEKLDIEAKKCLFGFCTNCIGQYGRGKELESKMQEIPKRIEKSYNFPRVARSAGLPGMEYYSQNFMNFESRKSKFEELKEALKDGNNHMIGLQGMGGTGKTTMAIEVGKEVQELKHFDKVIFVVVSKPADEKKIRGVIAKRLELQLKEEEESIHAEQVWTRIANVGKVLIILDDVWEELNLKNIGIQTGPHHKGCCSVLLTTRDLGVCAAMECQETIQLEVLSVEDALNLFLFHVGRSGNHCSHDLKHVALDIVQESGRLPIAVVAVAKMLKTWPPNDWQAALTKLKTPMPLHKAVDKHMTKVYNSLRLSYDNLENKEAQDLFLLCSLFPEDYEIPIEFLSIIAIGLGLFGEVDKYNMARSQVTTIKHELINSSLLLKVKEDCVKTHDLVREVALWIANEEIQAVMDSKTSLKENVRYSYSDINDFPNCFDGSKLEVLLIRIDIANCFREVPDAFFERMMNLRVLALICEDYYMQMSASSLLRPIQSLRNIRTLSISNWLLGDISILKNLRNLETLELRHCSIIELPNEVEELKKLRLLCLKYCSIEKNNPFEVIGKCSQIEELYYVRNGDILDHAKFPQITILPELQRYHIVGPFEDYDEANTSTERYFAPGTLKGIFSKEILKSLATRAETLLLGKYNEIGWTNLIPDFIPMEDGGMNNLIRLSLEAWFEIKCLIQTEHLRSCATVFSKLVELRLFSMDVEKLCCGPFPIDFLKQLTVLHLQKCLKLESTLFKGKLDLGNLKSIHLASCSIACVFQHPSPAQSLKQLETLGIFECDKLKYIIKDEGSGKEKVDNHDPNQKSHGSMFPKLKFLQVEECRELEFILPICFGEDLPLLEIMRIYNCEKLEYIFGQCPEEGDLYQMGKEIILPSLKEMEIEEVPKFVNIYPECYLPLSSEVQKSSPASSDGSKIKEETLSNNLSWASLCCFLPKSCATCVDDPSISKTTQPDHTASQALKIEHTARSLFTAPLYPRNLREMKIKGCFNLMSFFTLYIASSMLSLEILEVEECDGLKHIVTHEGIGHDHMNCRSIFPNLQIMLLKNLPELRDISVGPKNILGLQNLFKLTIIGCRRLKVIFSASILRSLPQLSELVVSNCKELVHIIVENEPNFIHSHKNWFPKLSSIQVDKCKSLKFLFSISTCGMLPNLRELKIKDAPELVQVFGCAQGKIKEGVLSKLLTLKLINLPSLHSFCQAASSERELPQVSTNQSMPHIVS